MADRSTTTCDRCGDGVAAPLVRTVRLTVDGAEIDVQRHCPDCFAAWISLYEEEMEPKRVDPDLDDDDSTLIVD